MTRTNQYILIILLVFSLIDHCNAQFKNYNTEQEYWYEGAVYNAQGKGAEGLVNYNFVTDLVRFELNGVQKTLSPANIAAFVMRDSTGTQRRFYALPHSEFNSGKHGYQFFELIFRNKNYTLFTRHSIRLKDFSNVNKDGVVTSSGIKELIFRNIYIGDTKGNLAHILERKISVDITHSNWSNPALFTRNKHGQVSKGVVSEYNTKKVPSSNTLDEVDKYRLTKKFLIEDFFGNDYKDFLWYVDYNDLNIKNIHDLKRALEFKS